MRRLYDMIADGKLRTDKEAIAVLFPGQTNPPHYFRLKNALRDYLHRMLFLIDLDLPHYHLRQKTWFDCYRQWATMKLPTGKGARTSQVGLATDLLRMTRKYEFTDLTVDIARSLRLYYGSIEGNLKKYEQYSALTREYDTYQLHLSGRLIEVLVHTSVNDYKNAVEVCFTSANWAS